MGWTAHFETDTGEAVTPRQLTALAENLTDHAGAVAAGGSRVEATFSVEADIADPVEAIAQAGRIYRAALLAAELDGTDVRASVMTSAEHDRELAG